MPLWKKKPSPEALVGLGLDKKQHYGRYQDGEDRRAKLAYKLAYKSLDIPDDDMILNVKNSSGGGWVVAGFLLGVLCCLLLVGVAAWMFGRDRVSVIDSNVKALFRYTPPSSESATTSGGTGVDAP